MCYNGKRIGWGKMGKLEGKVAVITGGAMGNGYGIAGVFLKYGAKVIILDYSDNLKESLQKLKRSNNTVAGFQVDIRDAKMVHACMLAIGKKFGHIDILVNNAGVSRLVKFEEMDDEMRDFHFDINIKGTWIVTKAALPYMKETGGSIINLSSVTGPMVADPGEVAYATTKAALIGFTKSLAVELASNKIRVNAILPGYIRTPMVEGMARETNSTHPEEVIKGIAAGIPMRRLGTIMELGEVAAFLACNESSYMTGQTLVIDGGSTLPETMSMGV